MASPDLRRFLVAAGGSAAGLYAGLLGASWWHDQTLPSPLAVPPALNWKRRPLEGGYGRYQVYERPGTGRPILLLHSFNAVASSFEMKPIAEHLADTTDRPVYAVDWLGFGRSSRPAIEYVPSVYKAQVHDVLTDYVGGRADIVALSLGCEYAAWAAFQTAPLVQRLVLISPTGLGNRQKRSPSTRGLLSLLGRARLFRLLFYHYTDRKTLRSFYERQIFLDGAAVSSDLVEYAQTTAHVKGAHSAPLSFIKGNLSLGPAVEELYAQLYRPTLVLTPTNSEATIQSFEQLPKVLRQNARHLSHRELPGGLMPHWERPSDTFSVIDSFLDDSQVPSETST